MKRAACRQTAQKKTRIAFEPETHFSSYPFGGATGRRRRRGPHGGIGIPGHGKTGKRRRETRQTKRPERIFSEPVGCAPVEAQQPKLDIPFAAAGSDKLACGAEGERVHREVTAARQVRFRGPRKEDFHSASPQEQERPASPASDALPCRGKSAARRKRTPSRCRYPWESVREEDPARRPPTSTLSKPARSSRRSLHSLRRHAVHHAFDGSLQTACRTTSPFRSTCA